MSSNIPSKVPTSGIPKPASSSATSASQSTTASKSQTSTSQPAPPSQPVSKKVEHPTLTRPSAQISSTITKPLSTSESKPPSMTPPNWAELEAKYKQDIEALTESAEMATIEKEIAEEKLDSCEREIQDLKDKLAEAGLQVEMLKREQQANQSAVGAGTSDSSVTVLQLQKVEEQNDLLKQALLKLRDISTKDKRTLEELQIEHEELQEKLLDLEEREQKYIDQAKIFEEQIDANQNAQEMVEKLTQQKTDLEDKLREMADDLDCMEKLKDLDAQILENARMTEIELNGELDKLRSILSEMTIKKRDMEDYLSDQERSLSKLKEENRILNEHVDRLQEQFKQGESIEQQKHQIENVAYKLNFSETKMAEKEAEISRYKRNLSEMEEQMNNLSLITKEQSAKIDELRMQIDNKALENSELQRALKKKMEEVSELEIRREMADKKLQSLQRDSETKIVNLSRTIETMKGVEIQHEEDMKRLMEDNEIIEKERRELRDQLNKSNRSLERSMQAGNMSLSMVTAQDTSLASLGISFQTTPSHQASPVHHHHHHHQPQQQPPQQQQSSQTGPLSDLNQSINIQSASRSSTSMSSTSGPAKHIAIGPDTDDLILMAKIKDLSSAFDSVNRKNYDLEVELALRELNQRVPPYNGSDFASHYDIDRTEAIRLEAQKLKRDIRAAMINQEICTKSRKIASVSRAERFNNSKLALRYQALENEANSLMSSSTLARLRPKAPLLQSTPVRLQIA